MAGLVPRKDANAVMVCFKLCFHLLQQLRVLAENNGWFTTMFAYELDRFLRFNAIRVVIDNPVQRTFKHHTRGFHLRVNIGVRHRVRVQIRIEFLQRVPGSCIHTARSRCSPDRMVSVDCFIVGVLLRFCKTHLLRRRIQTDTFWRCACRVDVRRKFLPKCVSTGIGVAHVSARELSPVGIVVSFGVDFTQNRMNLIRTVLGWIRG